MRSSLRAIVLKWLQCAVTIAKKNSDRAVVISDCDVQLSVKIEVTNRYPNSDISYRKVCSRLKGSISISQQDSYSSGPSSAIRVRALVRDYKIKFAISV